MEARLSNANGMLVQYRLYDFSAPSAVFPGAVLRIAWARRWYGCERLEKSHTVPFPYSLVSFRWMNRLHGGLTLNSSWWWWWWFVVEGFIVSQGSVQLSSKFCCPVAHIVGLSEFPDPTFSDVSPPVICPFVYRCSRIYSAGPWLHMQSVLIWLYSCLSPRTCNLWNIKSENTHVYIIHRWSLRSKPIISHFSDRNTENI
jgi:hypothetical protein